MPTHIEVYVGKKDAKMPTRTKSLPYVDNDTNMVFASIDGNMALLHTNGRRPEKEWDGFIFDKYASDKVIDGMIESLQWLKKHKAKLAKAKR